MGWIEDSIEEFRKLPPAGKIAVGGAAVGVAILAYAHYRANGGNAGSASVTGAFPGAVGVPIATDGAGGVWTFPPTVQSGTGSGVFLGTLGNGLAPGPGGVHAPPITNDGGLRTLMPVAPVAPAVPSFVQTAAAHIASSASAPLPRVMPKPAPMPTMASFIPTTIRPLPTPGRGRVA